MLFVQSDQRFFRHPVPRAVGVNLEGRAGSKDGRLFHTRMEMMTWHDAMSSGAVALDIDHHRILDLLGDAAAALSLRDVFAGGQAIDRLICFTTRHFEDEQAIHRDLGFPQAEAHAALHAGIAARSEAMYEVFNRATSAAEKLAIGESLYRFLRDTLLDHIVTEDAKLRRHVQVADMQAAMRPGRGARAEQAMAL